MKTTTNIMTLIILTILLSCGQTTYQDKDVQSTSGRLQNCVTKTGLIKEEKLRLDSETLLTTDITSDFVRQLKKTINAIDDSWNVNIDTLVKYEHITLGSGIPFGRLTLKKIVSATSIGQTDIVSSEHVIEYYIYKSKNDSLKNEIQNYHMLASCLLSNGNLVFEVLQFKGYLLFLPMYPCWTNGYSSEAKEFIRKLVIKLK